MGSRHVIRVDADTGEVLTGCMMYIPHRPRHTEKFFMAFQDGLLEIAKDGDLTGADMRVLLFLFGKLDFENFLHVSQKEIGEFVGMKNPNVSRSMKKLVAKGIVLDGPKVGRVHTYRLSADLGWRGRVTSLNDYRRQQLRVITGGKNTGSDSGDSGSSGDSKN